MNGTGMRRVGRRVRLVGRVERARPVDAATRCCASSGRSPTCSSTGSGRRSSTRRPTAIAAGVYASRFSDAATTAVDGGQPRRTTTSPGRCSTLGTPFDAVLRRHRPDAAGRSGGAVVDGAGAQRRRRARASAATFHRGRRVLCAAALAGRPRRPTPRSRDRRAARIAPAVVDAATLRATSWSSPRGTHARRRSATACARPACTTARRSSRSGSRCRRGCTPTCSRAAAPCASAGSPWRAVEVAGCRRRSAHRACTPRRGARRSPAERGRPPADRVRVAARRRPIRRSAAPSRSCGTGPRASTATASPASRSSRAGCAHDAAGSEWYFDGGPRPPSFSAKLLLAGLGVDRSSRIGFRLAWDLAAPRHEEVATMRRHQTADAACGPTSTGRRRGACHRRRHAVRRTAGGDVPRRLRRRRHQDRAPVATRRRPRPTARQRDGVEPVVEDARSQQADGDARPLPARGRRRPAPAGRAQPTC